nr:PREDICTED: trans-Golgi network integral membrane protein 1 isoform X1 [Tribolium castaneum]|eukprot:XP_008201128.1 PREDICTED: trans-Golgi network integral membrane protein 1 isoform X1 [Tribolium castaneum]
MNKMHIIYLFVGLYTVIGAPVEKSMYDAIQEKCPSVSSIPTFKSQPLFRICKDWKNISEISQLTETNAAAIRCLLYYQTFTEYCTQTQTINTSVSLKLEYDLDTLCDFVKSMPHKNLSSIFATRDNCEKICTDELELPHSVCKMSYYFAHLDVTPAEKLEKPVPLKPISTDKNTDQSPKTEIKPHPDILQPNPAPPTSINAAPSANKVVQETTSQKQKAKAPTAVQPPHIENLPNSEIKPDNTNPVVVPEKNAPQTDQNRQKAQPEQTSVENQNPAPQETKKVDPIEPKPPQDDKKVELNPGKSDNQQDLPQEEKILDDEDDEEQPPDTLENDLAESSLNAGPGSKPSKLDESEPVNYSTEMENDSYFFTYFMVLCVIFIAGYVCYHNKQKILALILEGRRGKRQYRGRRPNSANYHKLDSNLEEAISSSCKKNTSNVIY